MLKIYNLTHFFNHSILFSINNDYLCIGIRSVALQRLKYQLAKLLIYNENKE